MPEPTETTCRWEQVQRQWKWEWASYHPHTTVYWTAGRDRGTTELLEEAALAPAPPGLIVDLAYGSRWEKVSGTGTNVVVAEADLPVGVSPLGQGWQLTESVGR